MTSPRQRLPNGLKVPLHLFGSLPNDQPDRFVTISFGGGANVVWVNQYGLPGVRVDEAHELG